MSRLRLRGRFISDKFEAFMKDLAKDVGLPPQEFINSNPAQIEGFYKNGTFERHYSSDHLENTVQSGKGVVSINGEPVSIGIALDRLNEFKQAVNDRTGAVASSHIVSFSEFGTVMDIRLPDSSLFGDMERDEFNELMDEYDITTYDSDNTDAP